MKPIYLLEVFCLLPTGPVPCLRSDDELVIYVLGWVALEGTDA
jgi:hypothetical protein